MARARKAPGMAEDTTPWQDKPRPLHFSVVVKGAGRVLLPAEVRAALGVVEGDTLQGMVKDGQLTLQTPATALRRMQQKVRQLVPPGVSLVDELIAERRAENAREEEEVREYLARKASE